MPHRSCTGSSFSSTPSSPSPSSSSSCPSKQAIIKAQAPNNSKGYRNLLSYFPVDNKRSFLSYLQGISKEEKRGAEKTFRAEPQLQNEGNTKRCLFQKKAQLYARPRATKLAMLDLTNPINQPGRKIVLLTEANKQYLKNKSIEAPFFKIKTKLY